MRKKLAATACSAGTLLFLAFSLPQMAAADDFDRFQMPVSNPVYNGDARNVTMVRPILFTQSLPDRISVDIGGTKTKVDLGGEVRGAALQFSYAFNERLSLVAVKDGYVDCEPDNTLDDHSGWADIAAGLQYSFIYNPAQDFIMSGRLVYESTSGDSEVYQGNGSGNLAPAILFLKGWDKLQFSGTVGLVLPLDSDEENTMLYDSWDVSYAVTDWFRPLVELNHFHVLSSGDRDLADFAASGDQEDLVAAIATFNPCDIINLGGENNGDNKDLVTMAIGARFRITSWFDVGAAYEFPLTDNEETLLDDRVLVDAMLTFKF
ncbi:MAG: hypothetical protein M0P70_04275 [Desulfobulbaceae bacterium]|nr:hypothetical protein [Desulfobulbaceae bacterium]